MAKNITKKDLVETLEGLEMTLEEFACGVVKISSAVEVLSKSRLNWSTIVMLVAKASSMPQGDVNKVLEALPSLEEKFLKPEK